MAEVEAVQEQLREYGVQTAGISVDSVEVSAELSNKLGLSFPLLCDPERKVVTDWSLLNTRERGGIAFPATFVLDSERVVLFRSLDRLMSRVNPGPVLAFLSDWRNDPAVRRENGETGLQVPGVVDTVTALGRKWFGRR